MSSLEQILPSFVIYFPRWSINPWSESPHRLTLCHRQTGDILTVTQARLSYTRPVCVKQIVLPQVVIGFTTLKSRTCPWFPTTSETYYTSISSLKERSLAMEPRNGAVSFLIETINNTYWRGWHDPPYVVWHWSCCWLDSYVHTYH